jgi:hypothetical protein
VVSGTDQQQTLYLKAHGEETATLGTIDAQPTCLKFSANAQWLVVGTSGGRGRTYAFGEKSDGGTSIPSSVDWEEPLVQSDGRPRAITSCAVTNDGVIVTGNVEGRVARRERDGGWVNLTQRAAFRFSAPVQQVRVDPGGRYVSALAEWQLSGCVRPGLPGQSFRIWDMTGPGETWRIPRSSQCFPNQVVLDMGHVIRDGKPAVSPLVLHGRDPVLRACLGCGYANETPAEMLERLRQMAEKRRTKNLTEKTLRDTYGLSF